MTTHSFLKRTNNELLVGKCLKILHGFQCKHCINSIGVSFPDICSETIGSSIAFVSLDQSIIQHLMVQHYFQQMQKLKKFIIHDIIAVPENVPEVRFLRERKQDKQCAGGRQRRIRRGQRIAEKRGYDYQLLNTQGNSTHSIQHSHNIPMTSSHDATQVYYFRIQRYPTEERECNRYTSYGLGNRAEERGTVPEVIYTKK